MKKIIRLTESDLARIVRRVISENFIAYDISMMADKTHRVQGAATQPSGCQGIHINLQEVDVKTKKAFGPMIYYYVTRNAAMGSYDDKDYKISDVNNSMDGGSVTDYLIKKRLQEIAKKHMVQQGCK